MPQLTKALTQDIRNQQLLHCRAFVNGQWLPPQATFAVDNPATGELLATVGEISDEQLEMAIQAANKAQCNWAAQTAQQRADILNKWFKLIINNLDDLTLLLTREQGKPLDDAMAEIRYGAAFIEWFAEQGKRLHGDILPAASADKRVLVIKQPVGVVGAITPWNFPNAMITRKAAAALAAGCSFVVKPAAETPLSALALGYLGQQAGLPDGVFNVVTGTRAQAIGEQLTGHPEIAKFTFTGSTRTGRLLNQQCATKVKKVTMELGGNAPFILFADAQLDKAIDNLFANKFRNAGQTCISANRIYVHEQLHPAFIEKVSARMRQMQLGAGELADTDIGPLISRQASLRVHQLVEQAIAEGAHLVTGGLVQAPEDAFYPPTLLDRVGHGNAITRAEIFGPVVAVIPFDDHDDVIAMANDTDYGLAAYLFTESLQRTLVAGEQLQYGMVGLNDAVISNVAAPFGGVKQSGFGREGSHYGLEDYVNVKYLSLGGL